MNNKDKKALRIVEKAISAWNEIHSELSEAILYFEKTNSEASKIVLEITDEEARLIEQADLVFSPLLYKLKKAVIEKNKQKIKK